jgi:probable F420-dependent oxidoreductase
MRLGINLHNYGPLGHRRELLEAVDAADELGFDSVWVSDHIIMPKALPDPYGSIIEAMSTLAFIAGRSARLKLGTSVIVLPQRDPILLAKQAASLHELSAGRLTLGVGVGWVQREYEMLGAPWAGRGRTADEFIEVMQELWSNPDPTFDGTRIKFDDALFAPRPGNRDSAGHLPLVIGGESTGALRRVAKYADGWHAIHKTPTMMQDGKSRLQELTGGKSLEIQLRMQTRIDGSGPLPTVPHIAGNPAEVRASVDEFKEAGVDVLIVDFPASPLRDYLSQMRVFAAAVGLDAAGSEI